MPECLNMLSPCAVGGHRGADSDPSACSTDDKRLYSTDGERRNGGSALRPALKETGPSGIRGPTPQAAFPKVRRRTRDRPAPLFRRGIRPKFLACRSPGSRIKAPRAFSRSLRCGMAVADHSPITVAAPRRFHTGFPILPRVGAHTRPRERCSFQSRADDTTGCWEWGRGCERGRDGALRLRPFFSIFSCWA
jgi:hypothetical protein